MIIDDALADFVEGAVMIIVGTADADGVPGIARAVGVRADRAAGCLNLLVSAWQWPEAVAAMTATRRIAVTFAQPADYVSLQVKGLVEAIGPATADEGAQARAYIAGMTATLAALGLDAELAEPWQSDRDLMALSVRPEAVFVQTPGAQAGQARS